MLSLRGGLLPSSGRSTSRQTWPETIAATAFGAPASRSSSAARTASWSSAGSAPVRTRVTATLRGRTGDGAGATGAPSGSKRPRAATARCTIDESALSSEAIASASAPPSGARSRSAIADASTRSAPPRRTSAVRSASMRADASSGAMSRVSSSKAGSASPDSPCTDAAKRA